MPVVRLNHVMLGLGVAALAIPVLAQQSGPESLLPPGFEDQPPPQQQTAPVAPEPNAPRPAAPPPATPGGTAPPPPTLGNSTGISLEALPPAAGNGAEADNEDEIAAKYDLPPTARRSLDVIGPLTPELGGFDRAAFGRNGGTALTRIMRATRMPIVSRWGSILLRRALLSQVDTPADVGGADWVAERAWMLLRMGEADNARLLIQGVDSDQYTARLYSVAMQVQLASADPAGFCPLLPRAVAFSNEPGWFMAQAICASFSADQGTATSFLNQAQRRGIARGIDYRLAEKVVGAGPNSRRSVKIEWDGVSQLTTWRFGLATATNVEIPDALYQTVGSQVRAWEARAPGLAPMRRLPGAAAAIRLGVFSGDAARDFYDALAMDADADDAATNRAALLASAYHGQTTRARVDAMRQFWSAAPADGWTADHEGVSFSALPAIARAAAAVPPDAALGDDAPWLIAAMLSGGYDGNAARWASAVERIEGEASQRAWALLATGLARPAVDLTPGRIDAFIGADQSADRRYSRDLVAALAGLGRLPGADRARLLQQSGIDPSPRGRWSRAIMAAAERGERGTVALFAAVGMQTNRWSAMSPQNLYFIVAALDRVGLDPYARMIAAEAMTRL